jgi:MYXO-CTERM domain-containing protein
MKTKRRLLPFLALAIGPVSPLGASVMSFASVGCPTTRQATNSQTGTTAAQASNQCGYASTHLESGQASAQARDGYGLLTSNADSFGSGAYVVDAKATSSFSEMLTLSGGSGTGLVQYNFLFTGQLVEDGGQNLAPFTVTQGGDTIFSFGDHDLQNIARGRGNCLRDCHLNLVFTTQSRPFTFGVPFSIAATLTSEALNPNGFARTDITAELQSIVVTDAAGHPVNFSVDFQSDASSETPEAGTWALVLGGLTALGLGRRRLSGMR